MSEYAFAIIQSKELEYFAYLLVTLALLALDGLAAFETEVESAGDMVTWLTRESIVLSVPLSSEV